MEREHREFYLNPLYYDIAFDVRDTGRECEFMEFLVHEHAKRRAASVLELAAGPGYHALWFARRGLRSVALDLELAMVDHLHVKARAQGTPLEVIQADMRSFKLEEPVDLACNLFASFCYLLDHEDVLANLAAVHAALAPGGLYVIELPHPRKYLRHDVVTKDDWVMERDGVRVHTRWDIDQAVPDPLTQILDVRSECEVTEGGRKRKIKSRGRQRLFFAQELKLLAECRGLFKVVAWYGAMDRKVPFSYAKQAWRMVGVLQRA